MKTLPLAAAVLASLVATGATANPQDKHDGTHGAAGDTHGSAMSETHQRGNTADVGKDGTTPEQKMKKEVQDDWREDAEERRDADASKPEQR